MPTWDDVRALAWMSLAHHRARLGRAEDRALVARGVDALAARLARQSKAAGYRVWMEGPDFVWGSNAVMLNGAMLLLQGYRLNPKPEYLAAAQSGLDWVLGRNPTARSFVTGFGARPSLHPHHRPSIGYKLAAPVPGFVTGGPNPLQQDKAECPPYPSRLPALSYLDHACSYASNEVAINWNAPLVYVTAALRALTPKETTMKPPLANLDDLLREEEQLRFERFSNADALDIGMRLVALAREAGKPVTIEIRRNGALLFAHATDGAPPDHAEWIRRKANLANRLGHSSYYVHTEVLARGGDIDAMPGFDARDYAAHGGAFPIVVEGSGQIGTITVSGLPGPQDHALVVCALRAWFKRGA
ncbi:heme-degrading domain-containing protein [Massilia sp. Se16.2.3]|uniref:heme-degrading domain-containing protein n=1 Tax=Massilia sp. Se16.2.3 TaxID=2709303 RepID=UPI0022772EE5|nr:heme-degrading domain-containing protein [Massilia sp. Se16.2.3]